MKILIVLSLLLVGCPPDETSICLDCNTVQPPTVIDPVCFECDDSPRSYEP